MGNKVLALTNDGRVTYCVAPDDQRGKGRCNHCLYQKEGESDEEFITKANSITNGPSIIKAHLDNNHNLKINEKTKIYKNIMGSYDKTIVLIDGDIFYLKFDSNDSIKFCEDIESKSYPAIRASVGESFASAIASCSDMSERMRTAEYNLVKVDRGGKTELATISRNYIEDNEFEIYLSDNYSNNCILSKNDYFDALDFGGKNFASKLEGKIDNPEEYVVNISLFDTITINTDRKNNAYNSLFARNMSDKTLKPINMDFGRCFKTSYSERMEIALKSGSIEMETITDLLSFDSPSTFENMKNSKLKFDPIEIDTKELENKFDSIVKICEGTDCEYYSKFLKIKILNHLEGCKGYLWKEKEV